MVVAGKHGIEGRKLLCSPAGITRERLESFDRPIKVEPEDYPDKRDALIGEFQNYLGILKVRGLLHWRQGSQQLYQSMVACAVKTVQPLPITWTITGTRRAVGIFDPERHRAAICSPTQQAAS